SSARPSEAIPANAAERIDAVRAASIPCSVRTSSTYLSARLAAICWPAETVTNICSPTRPRAHDSSSAVGSSFSHKPAARRAMPATTSCLLASCARAASGGCAIGWLGAGAEAVGQRCERIARCRGEVHLLHSVALLERVAELLAGELDRDDADLNLL